MHPLPLVLLIIALFLASALTLLGLIVADVVAEHRRYSPRRDELGLSLESLIQELTATA
jgi:hypothetical protein